MFELNGGFMVEKSQNLKPDFKAGSYPEVQIVTLIHFDLICFV